MDAAACALVPAPPGKPSALRRLREIEAGIPPEADLILFGDSLAAGWPPDLYGQAFPNRRVFNFGLPGDRVQTSAWRLENLSVGHLRPRELLVLLGTNNLGDGDPPDAVAAALAALVGRAAALWGEPATIVATIPRRGELPGFREADRGVLNATLARALSRVPRARILDSDMALAAGPGEAPSLLADHLHLSEAGYGRLSAALAALLGPAGDGP
jgi:lysophospholipase L1-like esterase